MDFKSIDLRQWWMGLVTFGAIVTVTAVAAKYREAMLLGLGIAAIGFGEWINHPLQTTMVAGDAMFPMHVRSGYPRSMKPSGIALDLLGFALIAIGLWRALVA